MNDEWDVISEMRRVSEAAPPGASTRARCTALATRNHLRPLRLPRAPQLLQEALCTALATQKASRGPSGGHARRSSSIQEALWTAPATRKTAAVPRLSGPAATRAAARRVRLSVVSLPHVSVVSLPRESAAAAPAAAT